MAEVLAEFVVGMLLVALVTLLGVGLAVRAVRRTLTRSRHPAVRVLRAATAPMPWPARLASNGMWREVHAAEDAVERAQAVGAPVGELPALCRRLRGVAGDVDSALRLDSTAHGQLREVVQSARRIRFAAAAAVAETTAPVTDELRRDIETEVSALSAGLSRMRAALRP